MNDFENQPSACCSDLDGAIRENPTRAILLGLGAGVALALIVRAMQPRPANRISSVIDDLRDHLADLAEPAYRRARGVAGDGADLLKGGLDQLSDLHLDRTVNRVSRKVRQLFK